MEVPGEFKSDLPVIDIKNRYVPEVTQEAWEALTIKNQPPYLFRYGNQIVRLVSTENKTVTLELLDKNRLRHELARAAVFGNYEGENIKVFPPPSFIVDDMLADPNPPLPVLDRVVDAPIFSEDGQLQNRPGYCPSTRCYLNFNEVSMVRDLSMVPSDADIDRAKELLEELIGDFPFISQAERVHAIALYLSGFVRDKIPGPIPIYIIEAPTPGTGKTLLAQVLTYPATGRFLEAMSEGRNNDEMRKRITAKVMQSPTYVLIDNVRHQVAYSSLASVITSTVWEDRILGASRTVRLQMRGTWVITGNNPSLSSEISRRSVRIRLDTGQEQPWLRNPDGFRHPNLFAWVKENREHLIWAALVLVQNWIAKGKPTPTNIPTMGMFEDWCRVMGGILQANGIEGFLGNLNEMYTASDREVAVWRSFAEEWFKAFGSGEVGVAELYDLVLEKDIPIDLGSGLDRSQKIRLGINISKMRQRQFGSYRIVSVRQKNHAQRWILEPVRGYQS